VTTATPPSTGPLGEIYLPREPGTGVGTFQFIISPDRAHEVEIGVSVAADTLDGVFIGEVVDMRTVGRTADPCSTDLSGSLDVDLQGKEVIVKVATVSVFHSPARQSISAGLVRPATAVEMSIATGEQHMKWPVPVGVKPLVGGGYARACLDGEYTFGFEGGHVIVNGASGLAAKSSVSTVLLRSAFCHGYPLGERGPDVVDRSVGAVLFSPKGADLLFLDQPPAATEAPTPEDLEMYAAMGVDPTPFADFEVYAPGLPGGSGVNSVRADAIPMRLDLRQVWSFLRFLFPWMYEDEKVMSFLGTFEARKLNAPRVSERITTFAELDRFFATEIEEAEAEGRSVCFGNTHIATMHRLRRMLCSLPDRAKGLITTETSRSADDVPITGWHHGKVVVVDIAALPTDMRAVVIARTLDRLMRSAEEGGLGVSRLVCFVDELNEMAPKSGTEMAGVRRVVERVSTQGRYSGLTLIGACQKMSRVSELVTDNAATKLVGRTSDGELNTGVYGRLPGGLAETIATLPKGQTTVYHYSYRAPMVVRFPRPAWRMGVPTGLEQQARPTVTGTLQKAAPAPGRAALSDEAIERLTEGLDTEIVEQVIAGADDPHKAVAELAKHREPDMAKVALPVDDVSFDPSNPFGIED
jgi:uncharacterized protein